jgi:hypothetical protein
MVAETAVNLTPRRSAVLPYLVERRKRNLAKSQANVSEHLDSVDSHSYKKEVAQNETHNS